MIRNVIGKIVLFAENGPNRKIYISLFRDISLGFFKSFSLFLWVSFWFSDSFIPFPTPYTFSNAKTILKFPHFSFYTL